MNRTYRAARASSLVLTALALIGPQALCAQSVPAEEARERTGPSAEPAPLPPIPRPEELPPPLLPSLTETAPAAPVVAGGATVRQVRLDVQGDGGDAVPPAHWVPPQTEGSGLRLQHRRGEALSPDWVRAQFAANIEPEGASAARVVALVQLLNRAFLTAGFINSGLSVAQQPDIAGGILHLRLVYGGLRAPDGAGPAVTVEWGGGRSGGLTERFVRSYFPSARQSPVSALDIERDFRRLAEHPAVRTVNADLRPGARPGEASLHVIVHPEERFDLYLGAANDRSPSVGGERLFAGGFVRNLIAAGDIVSGEFGVTRGVEDAQLAYATPLITPRTFLSLRGSFNDAAVIDRPLLPLDISARDRSVQAGLSHRVIDEPLRPSEGRWLPSRSLALGLAVAHRWQKSFLFGEPFSFSPGSVDGRSEYGALRLTADYLVRGVSEVLAVSVTGTMGLGGTQSDIPGVANPSDTFTALLAQVNWARRLAANGLELRARLTGQIAGGVLYSGERLSIGGETSVRGYRENLFLVDEGVIASVELAYPFSLSPRRSQGAGVDWGAFSIAAFADAAAFRNEAGPAIGESRLASVGLSLTWNPSDAVMARASYGIALNEIPLSGDRDIQDRGFHFRIVIHPLRLFPRRAR